MPRGGARPNSGPKKGTKYGPQQETITKEQAREAVRTLVLEQMRPMIEAQFSRAKGLKYLVTREKGSGKFIKVTEAMAQAFSESDEQPIIEVWEKAPCVQSWTDLMNRALDKPKDQEQEIKITGEVELVQRLAGARTRLNASQSR